MEEQQDVFKDNSIIDPSSDLFYRAKVQNSQIGKNCTVGDFTRVLKCNLGDYVRLDRNNLVLQSTLNSYTYTGKSSVIMHAEIGKFCSISWNCTIGPGEHDYNKITSHDFLYNDYNNLRPSNDPLPYNRFSKKMVIGNDVWIGCNATILRGLNIGNGAVIGANSLVNKNVPPYAIVAGNPAKIIKFRFPDETIDKLQKLKWWDFPANFIRQNYKLFLNENIVEVIKKFEQNPPL